MISDTIGTNLKRLIEEHNITQTALAKAIGISPVRLSYYVNSKREPDCDTLVKFASFFNVDMDDLFKTAQTRRVIKTTTKHCCQSTLSSVPSIHDDLDTINIPVKLLNARTYSQPSSFITLSKRLLPTNVSKVLAFEVSTRIGDICKGDYLIVSDINECAPTHGDVVCIAGRNCKLYKVSRCDNEVFVDNFAGTNLQKLSDLYNLNIYVVLFTITKYRTS